MSRIIPVAILALILSPSLWAQELCTPSDRAKAGCNGPEVCMLETITPFKTKSASCVARISEPVTAIGCLARPKGKDGKEFSTICSIEWDGPITPSSVKSLVDFIDAIPIRDGLFGGPYLQISSLGGDVRSALQLGRKLRERNAHITPTYCASACVFVLAGGVQRTVFDSGPQKGQIVIHRPYNLDVDETNIQRAQERYNLLNNEIASYLSDMNVPESLLDAMLAIPPHRGKTLSRDELQKYRLDEYDPVYEQMRNARFAKKKGLSMTEYLRRKTLEEQCRTQHFSSGKTYPPRHCSEVIDTGQIGVDDGGKAYEQLKEELGLLQKSKRD